MRSLFQRRHGARTDPSTAWRPRRITPTTLPRHPSCRNPSRNRVARWPNRDPLGDEAFFKSHFKRASDSKLQALRRQALLPPYVFALNDPIGGIDLLGLWVARPDPPPPNITTILCQGGKAVPRLAPDTSLNSRCVNRCILSHERVHAEEANAQNACAGKPDGVAVAASSYAERVNSEINALQAPVEVSASGEG